MEVEVGVVLPQAKEQLEHQNQKNKEGFSPRACRGRMGLLTT